MRGKQMKKRAPIKLSDSFYALLNYLRNKGYAESSVLEYENHARWITRFMQDNGYDTYTPEAYAAVIKHIENGVRYEDLTERQKRRYHCATVLYEFQQTGNYTFRRKKAEEVIQGGLKEDIEIFMEYKKSLLRSQSTQNQYRLDLLRFNIFLDETGISDVSQITTALILQYIQERMARFTQPTIRHALTSIRQFLFFLHETGRTKLNYSLVVPNCSAPPPQKIPSTYSKEEIERLLGVMDRADPKGKRDYAMILIASRLGLRSSDICQLKFTELDWKQNRILLKQKKTGAQIELPLLSDVGEAIIDYLKYGRPQSDLPFVFLKHVPPYDGVTRSAFVNTIKTGMRRAGIIHDGNRKHGPHALRHSLATVLLEQHTPLPVITGILGHKNPETTKIYLAIDLTSLRKCALIVPAIAPDYYEKGDNKRW